MTTNLPYHISERCFRKYELVIAAVVTRWPKIVVVSQADMGDAATTFAARLRDALISLRTYHWETKIDMEKFSRIQSEIAVSHKHELSEVWIGCAKGMRATDAAIEPLNVPDMEVVTISVTAKEEKTLLCNLAVLHAFSKRIKVFGFKTEDVLWFERNYDIALQQQEDGSHILI